jgi:hypothetical protein
VACRVVRVHTLHPRVDAVYIDLKNVVNLGRLGVDNVYTVM